MSLHSLYTRLLAFWHTCHHLKLRFLTAIAARKRKLHILSSYWDYVAHTCAQICSNQAHKAYKQVKVYNGHKFVKVAQEVKVRMIREYLREFEHRYRQEVQERRSAVASMGMRQRMMAMILRNL